MMSHCDASSDCLKQPTLAFWKHEDPVMNHAVFFQNEFLLFVSHFLGLILVSNIYIETVRGYKTVIDFVTAFVFKKQKKIFYLFLFLFCR